MHIRMQDAGRIAGAKLLILLFCTLATPVKSDTSSPDLVDAQVVNKVRSLLAGVASPSMLSWEHISRLGQIARRHVAFNRWNEPLKINQPYNGYGTYLYITKKELSKNLPVTLRNNCTAVMGTKVIVCDGAFLDMVGRCLQDPDVSVKPKRGEDASMHETILSLMRMKADAMLSWIVGHEIGHISRGHTQKLPLEGWRLPNADNPQPLGTRVEVEADDYAIRSMLRLSDDAGANYWSFFSQTIGLLAWHMKYDEGRKIYFNPAGHPPIAARLYNAWSIYKRDYDLSTELNSDDQHIIQKIREAEWQPSEAISTNFCERSDKKYQYPIFAESQSLGSELANALLVGWIYRDRTWSDGVLSAIDEQKFSNDALENARFKATLRTLNDFIFAVEPQRSILSPEVEKLAELGLQKERQTISTVAQVLAMAVLHGAGQIKLDSEESQSLLRKFDERRKALPSGSAARRDDIIYLARSQSLVFLIFKPDDIGSEFWTKTMHSIIRTSAESTRSGSSSNEALVNYLAHWVTLPEWNKRSDVSATRAAQQFRAIDTLYVASHVASYDFYAAKSRSVQASAASKVMGHEHSKEVWSMYLEAAHRFVRNEPDRAFEMASRGLTILENNSDAEGGLPKVAADWQIEFRVRLGSVAGWAAVLEKNYPEAIRRLEAARSLAQNGCFWIKRGELCIQDRNPTLVYIWDNLAEAYLGEGDLEKARLYANEARIYRSQQVKHPDFKGEDNDTSLSSAKVWAAILLNREEEHSRGIELVSRINEAVVQALKPQRPRREMFTVVVAGKKFDLLDELSPKPSWLIHSEQTFSLPEEKRK
ncbi:tetratricopeptide repeat protein [Bradyrhizobium japonicum]|uniref:tetratricopeptide repeat protein n=1 Tax=Bradyrhizobium japonicum TaxID=375 RepID=UPI00040A0C67|nr:hypothetical protein [Bradyrhizobium japonicum]MCP1738217.1 tetratricopeptide (TPR) repeat protein [Bradyrhizobium japonicum]MCP1856001.1 tetratricopeptide (TPR) repeat protein [Bradyrhizobium japonicum]MCP1897184.1 tetratricopeptide (TPR) repeat protein [Bradyrhizobium japonicum]MCW2330768.1 tetratricopeptide (TPR) repeat protein [Bradyrhizobium japonicum]WLB96018.1 hypothetical protein QIH92_41325 [Bradyrhizobium japonicum USDA 123]